MAFAKKKDIFVLGAGFIGGATAKNLNKANYTISVSVRSKEKMKEFQRDGFFPYVIEVGNEQTIPQIQCEILVISYPLGGRKMEHKEYLLHAEWINRYFNNTHLKQVILTSSTSVYPDGIGEVDESCKQRPKHNAGNQLDFEESLRVFFGDKLIVLRLAGLVGEKRNPGVFLAGKTAVPNAMSPVNMVHQMDVVRFIHLIIEHQITGEIYNLCHPNHPTRQTYYQKASKSLNLIPPKFSDIQIKNPKIVSSAKSMRIKGFKYLWAID